MKDSELLGKRISKRWWGSGWFPLKVQMGDFWWTVDHLNSLGKLQNTLVCLGIFELGLKKRGKTCFFSEKNPGAICRSILLRFSERKGYNWGVSKMPKNENPRSKWELFFPIDTQGLIDPRFGWILFPGKETLRKSERPQKNTS